MPLPVGADLDFMLQDSGVPVRFGAQSTFGILRRASIQDAGDLRFVGTHITLTIRDGTLTDLAEDAAITVDDDAFVIRQIGHRLSDGTRRLVLVEAAGASA